MPLAKPSPKKNATRGLGRGLSSLLGDGGIATTTGAVAPAAPGFRGYSDRMD